MATETDTTVQAATWLKPAQIGALRDAAQQTGASYLRERNEALVATLADTGLRVGELVALDVDHLRDDNSTLYLPGEIQKDYPTDASPSAKRMGLGGDLPRTLTRYLRERWKDSPALFPSRSADRMTTQAVRDALEKIATTADVRPYHVDGSRGSPADVTPHTLRHSVAWRMMNAEDGNTPYDVRNRLRHRSIQTTERVYDHFDRI
jgi:integrase/recombinase XerC/integrase/recombinase XerD